MKLLAPFRFAWQRTSRVTHVVKLSSGTGPLTALCEARGEDADRLMPLHPDFSIAAGRVCLGCFIVVKRRADTGEPITTTGIRIASMAP